MSQKKEFFIKYILFSIIGFFLCFFELPYYIEAPGGLDNLNNKVKVENGYQADGSINLTYVTEIKGTIPFLVIAYFHPDWDIIPKSNDNVGTLNYDTLMERQKVLMKQSYTSAIKYAYEAASKEVDIIEEKCYVIYLFEESKTDLEVGDQIIDIDGKKINKCEDISNIVNEKNAGDKSTLTVIKDKKENKKNVEYVNVDDKVIIGIQLGTEFVLETNPKYQFKFNSREFGPSGGLMISLAVYNSLVEEDITGGKIIAGTGTLSSDGSVGEIGGINYKLKGAVKKKADVFFVPSGENYQDALKLKEDNNYDIELVEVKKFSDALAYLNNNVVKK